MVNTPLKSALYIVATPIGNLADMTFRAVDTLQQVDAILCEDTRITKQLCKHYNISTPLWAYHLNRDQSYTNELLDHIDAGKSLALVSDAGTPAISDPGSLLVAQAHVRGISVIAIPGASALTAALSIAGVASKDIWFTGFLPKKKGRQTALESILKSDKTIVLYVSSHRIIKDINDIANSIGHDREIVVIKELTKMYEQTFTGACRDIIAKLEADLSLQKGEFVVIIKAKK